MADFDVRYPRRAPRRKPLVGRAASEWMDLDQAASDLRVGLNTVRRRVDAGVLGSTTMAGRMVVSRADVENLAAGIAAGTEARDRRTRTNREGRLPNTWNTAGEVQTRPAAADAAVSREHLPGGAAFAAPEPPEQADLPPASAASAAPGPDPTPAPWRPGSP